MDIDQNGITDVLLVAAPMYLGSGNKETGRVYIYTLSGVRQQWHWSFFCWWISLTQHSSNPR